MGQPLHLKEEKCIGEKHSKERITGLAIANVEGEKPRMFVIGKFAKHRCFKSVLDLPCRYRAKS